MHLAADQVGKRGGAAAIRHMQHVDAGHQLEQLAGEMMGASNAGRGNGDFAGVGFGIGDELGTVLASTDGCTSITMGNRLMVAIGSISLMKSKLSFSYRVA